MKAIHELIGLTKAWENIGSLLNGDLLSLRRDLEKVLKSKRSKIKRIESFLKKVIREIDRRKINEN